MSWVVTARVETDDPAQAKTWSDGFITVAPGAQVEIQEHVPYVPTPEEVASSPA